MIAPDFRKTEGLELMSAAQTFISSNYGKKTNLKHLDGQMWLNQQNEIHQVNNLRNTLINVDQCKDDVEKLTKLKDTFLQYVTKF